MDPISLLIQLVIIILILGLAWFIIDRLIPLDRTIKLILMGFIGLIALIYVLRLLRFV